ncbi:uncharacterized protein LOC143222617 isoform X4 [Tachypleus tridentatus]|uniref:uncharacterized protein LOC143222617 isoform X4 n=1 Tax=Tachypleus tridentatus TaxID=6853 RepID=UPI003FD42C52
MLYQLGKRLHLFANSEPVRGFEEGALQMCFADFRQIFSLHGTGQPTFMTMDKKIGERSRQEEKYIFSIKKESTRQEVGRNCPKTAQTVNIKQ